MWSYLGEETEAASANTAGFREEWRCRGPVVTERAILIVNGTSVQSVHRPADAPQLSQYSETARNGLCHM